MSVSTLTAGAVVAQRDTRRGRVNPTVIMSGQKRWSCWNEGGSLDLFSSFIFDAIKACWCLSKTRIVRSASNVWMQCPGFLNSAGKVKRAFMLREENLRIFIPKKINPQLRRHWRISALIELASPPGYLHWFFFFPFSKSTVIMVQGH